MDLDTYRPIVIKEKAVNYPVYDRLDSPEKIADVLIDVFGIHRETEEYAYVLAFNSNFRLIGVFELSHGIVDTTVLNPREVFAKALLVGAKAIVLAHNHPSGDVTPSDEDYVTTRRMVDAGKVLGVPVVDHLIVGCNRRPAYYSFEEAGQIKKS